MNKDYDRIAAAIRFIDAAVDCQPGLEEIALAAGVSVPHCQRLFRRWAGVSPGRFLQYLTVQHAKRLLDESVSVLDTALEVGLSGPSRLHDQFVSVEAVSPGEYRRHGAGLTIRYGRHPTAFGEALIAMTGRGICALAFSDADAEAGELARLQAAWPAAELRHSPQDTAATAASLSAPPSAARPLSLLVRGTNFQLAVWRALLQVPAGSVCTYGQLAARAGAPGGARAAGGAVGANPIAWLIPCHRVIRSTGESGGYRWGGTRKRAMLAWEAAQRNAIGRRAVG